MVVWPNDFGLKFVENFALLDSYGCTRTPLLEPMNIANGGMKAFQAEKRLRSAEFHNHQVYALYRLCNLLDDLPQTAVRSVLRRILTIRQCAIPRGPKPLVLPLLAHEPFQSAVEQWMSEIIINSKDYMIPFHLPHKKCVAGKHRSLRDVIYNNIAVVEQWQWDSPPPCNCAEFRLRHPHAHIVDGHIASPLVSIQFFQAPLPITAVFYGLTAVSELVSLFNRILAQRSTLVVPSQHIYCHI